MPSQRFLWRLFNAIIQDLVDPAFHAIVGHGEVKAKILVDGQQLFAVMLRPAAGGGIDHAIAAGQVAGELVGNGGRFAGAVAAEDGSFEVVAAGLEERDVTGVKRAPQRSGVWIGQIEATAGIALTSRGTES